MDRDRRYLLDMLMAANRILERSQEQERADLDTDISFQETVFWQMCILGEAANHVSERFRLVHADVPWPQISGIRNRLIHGYGEIDHDIVWSVIRNHLPNLVRFLRTQVEAYEPGRED